MENIISVMYILYYNHSRKRKCLPDSSINENSVSWRERKKKKNKQNKNNDMNNTRILPVHVRTKTKRESFN